MDAGLTVFARFGYAGATTAAICREAGTSSGTFFHYFPTKDSLILAILHEGTAETHSFFASQEQRSDANQVLREYVHHAVRDLRDPRASGFIAAVSGLAMREEIMAALKAEDRAIAAGLTHWIGFGQKAGQIRRDLSAERLAEWIMLVVDGFAGRLGASENFDVLVEEPMLMDIVDALVARSPS